MSENDLPENQDKDLVSSIDPNPEEHVIDDSSGVPVLPLRDVVVYPHMVIPLFVGRQMSIVALDKAMNAGKRIMLVAQKTADLDEPQPSDLYEVGTLATILQLLKLPDGTVKVLVEGGERALVDRINVEDHFSAEITLLKEDDRHDEREIDVLVRSIISQFEAYVKLNKKVPPEVLTSLSGIDEPGRLADTVAAHMARVFYRGAYKPPREFNWVIGVFLLVMTLLMSFTGYLLPWDQLAYWAVTVGTAMAGFVPVVGGTVEEILVFEQVRLEGEDLLDPQRPLLIPGARQAESLVPGR